METHKSPLVWRRKARGIFDAVSDERVSLYKFQGEYWVEISGPPLWPLVNVARATRTSCGGVRFVFPTRAEATKFTDIYLRLFWREPGTRNLRVISVLELMSLLAKGSPPVGTIELDPYDSECAAVWT